MKFGIRGQLTDIISDVKFLVDRFRGYGVLTPPKLQFPIDLLRCPYNSDCETTRVTFLKVYREQRSTAIAFPFLFTPTKSYICDCTRRLDTKHYNTSSALTDIHFLVSDVQIASMCTMTCQELSERAAQRC